jgi:uncharacterized protein (DUF2236 family)
VTSSVQGFSLPSIPTVARVRAGIEAEVLTLLRGSGAPVIDFDDPRGDPGLFGPDAVCWRVHGDFAGMMAGGIAALLLQMLHPLALAGVVEHSNFRADMIGRLRRTATFIGGTTFGPSAAAEQLIDHVRKVHKRVVGHAPDGRAYAADDPALLTWIHVAEVDSFLRGYRTYVDPRMPLADQDRYFDETALVAEKLGAKDIPRSRAAVDAYLDAMRPMLAVTETTREVARLVLDAHPKSAAAWPVGKLFMEAGVDLLPPWAKALAGLDRFAAVRGPAARAGVRAMAPLFRWAMRDVAVVNRARRRCAA